MPHPLLWKNYVSADPHYLGFAVISIISKVMLNRCVLNNDILHLICNIYFLEIMSEISKWIGCHLNHLMMAMGCHC